jgi:hypothetical protein
MSQSSRQGRRQLVLRTRIPCMPRPSTASLDAAIQPARGVSLVGCAGKVTLPTDNSTLPSRNGNNAQRTCRHGMLAAVTAIAQPDF